MHQLGEDGRFLNESRGVGRRVGKGSGSRGGVLVGWVSVSRCRGGGISQGGASRRGGGSRGVGGGGGDLAGGVGPAVQGRWVLQCRGRVPRCRGGPKVGGGSPNAQQIYSARQFGIKDMELKTVRVRNIVWMGGYTRWSVV